ncbi:MAG: sensor histidine kinase [Balneolaceae bacterium]
MRSFYLKLALIFSLILVGLGIIIAYITMSASLNFFQETIQKSNEQLAYNLAQEFQPIIRDTLDESRIHEKLQQVSGRNPQYDIYLLNRQGVVLGAFLSEADQAAIETMVIDPFPLERFVAGEQLPILGMDPRRSGKRSPFSAARLTIAGAQDAFLYVVLEGSGYQEAAQLVSDSFIAKNTLFIISLIIGTGILLGLFLFRLLTQRLRKIKRTVVNFERGQLEQRIDVVGNDELSELATSFNQMADTITDNLNQLKKNDRLRRELVANVSHDLRSPLASIQGYLETIQLRRKDLSEEEFEEYFSTVIRNAQKLNRLIADLFELSKFDSQDVTPNLEYISMAELVQDLTHQFRPLAEDKNITLNATFPDKTSALVYADISLLDRALSNLIDNAIKHTPEGGTVSINSIKDGTDVVVEISDTGVGISEEDLQNIFDRFYQVDKSRTPGSGAGLGLSIAKKIFELHNARVSVKSLVNKGTTFRISIPTQAA